MTAEEAPGCPPHDIDDLAFEQKETPLRFKDDVDRGPVLAPGAPYRAPKPDRAADRAENRMLANLARANSAAYA